MSPYRRQEKLYSLIFNLFQNCLTLKYIFGHRRRYVPTMSESFKIGMQKQTHLVMRKTLS